MIDEAATRRFPLKLQEAHTDLIASGALHKGTLAWMLGIDPDAVELSVNEVVLGQAEIGDAILEASDGIDLLPSTIELAGAEAQLLTRPGREFVLQSVLEDVRGDYDVILLDCSPSLGVLTLSALTAATVVISMRIVGLLLISALMILPNATGQQLGRSFRGGLVWAVLVGMLTSVGGVVTSFYADTPSGATMVAVSGVTVPITAIFFPPASNIFHGTVPGGSWPSALVTLAARYW